VFPHALCQWEDFSKQKAFAIRDTYLHDLVSFNDDIQGTGAVTLAALISAMKIKKEPLTKQVYLIYGAGAGGVGIAEQIEVALIEAGLGPEEARARIFTVDSKGLVTTERELEPYKQKFAKDPAVLEWYSAKTDGNLMNVIQKARVTVLIGTSGQPGAFSRYIVQAMQGNSRRPVILPLSNPTAQAEAHPVDIYKWTSGSALVATGSPFEPVVIGGMPVRVGQCNNVFIFPGMGLGVMASGAKEVLPQFFTAAAQAVAEQVPAADLKKGILLPSVAKLREVSLAVASAVGEAAIGRGVAKPCVYSTYQHDYKRERLLRLIEMMGWQPRYLPIVPR
jgi:malate dehydrogenase (oxaloacetate-decarboxylating)